ncbi:DUF86 domain-containing protein [Planctomycetota bacterium]
MARLKELRRADEAEFLEKAALHHLAERYLHLAVEACLDLANHWVAERGLPPPATNRDTFTVLERAGELDGDLAERLRSWAGFRNILVHEYLRIDHSISYRAMRDELGDLERFAAWALDRMIGSEQPDEDVDDAPRSP